MKNIYLFYIVFQVLKVLLIKICKIPAPDLLFLFVFISFYISRYRFSQIFRTWFDNIWKKCFHLKFSFSTDSLRLPQPHLLNGQNPLSVANVFCQCSLTDLPQQLVTMNESKAYLFTFYVCIFILNKSFKLFTKLERRLCSACCMHDIPL